MAYECRDVAIILSQLKFKKSQTSIMNENKFLNLCLFLKAKGTTKSIHEVLGLWQRSLRQNNMMSLIFDVIGRLYPKDQK